MTGSEDGSNSATLGVASLQAAARQHGSWRRSSYCGTNACVEVLHVDGRVMVRNSGDAIGLTVEFSRAEWQAFLDGVRAGEFEVPNA